MRKPKPEQAQSEIDEMLDEYDFTGGVRGKYAEAMKAGYRITIHNEDGTTLVTEVPPEGTIVLEPDVREYFPDSESVNNTLRSLITLIPMRKSAAKKRPQKSSRGRQQS
jgi:hypothetical protein